VPVGPLETGRAWLVRLLGLLGLLVVGSLGAGKSSVVWSILWHLAPAIRSGLVPVFGVDPKGGMELGRAPRVFHTLVYGNGPGAVELLEHVGKLTRQRAEWFRDHRGSVWTAESGLPFLGRDAPR
jgi:DNA segregation ATPase FtsK/SpoIIIE, S-DNA-T family